MEQARLARHASTAGLWKHRWSAGPRCRRPPAGRCWWTNTIPPPSCRLACAPGWTIAKTFFWSLVMPERKAAVLDPVTREIMRNSLACSADEMAVALYRTAYSTIVRDCLDYSTSLCDERGRMIAQGVTIPLHLGSVPYAMEALFRRFGDDIAEGDVFIMNDPFDGGMHIPDIFIIKPVFWEGERAGFA